MKFPEIPENETERLKSLYMMDLLDKKDDERGNAANLLI